MPSPSVDDFMATLDHPLKREVQALREIVLGAAPGAAEGVKWNAPSFSTTEHFATFNLRPRDRVQLVLHRGAKVRDGDGARLPVDDPSGLLDWRSGDRALVEFRDMAEVDAGRAALTDLVRQWVEHV